MAKSKKQSPPTLLPTTNTITAAEERLLRDVLDDDEVEAEQLPPESPEEFAKRFFGDSSPQETQEGLPTLAWLKEQFRTKSAAIRYLNSELGGSHPPKVIAKHLGIRYQHARNVCTTTLKRGPNEDWRPRVPQAKVHDE
jgi:hypothetical protein